MTTVDSGTLGRLRLSAVATACLPVWEDFMVTPAEPYNTLFAGTDKLTVDVSTAAVTSVAAAIFVTPANKFRTDTNGNVKLTTAARAEPGKGAPAVNADLALKIDYQYKSWRNKKTQGASTWSLYNDAGAVVDQRATVSDDGTTATKGEIVSGP